MSGSIRDLVVSMMGAREPVQPSTQSFPPLNTEQISRELRVEERGKEAGSANQPPVDATEPDLAELDVLAAIQRLFRKAQDDYVAAQDLYEGRVRRASITGDRRARIESLGESTLADFSAAIINDQNQLHILRQEVEGRDAEFAAFQTKHGLARLPRAVSGGERVLAWMVLVMLVLLESVLNGMLFAEGSEAGLIGGVVQALILSLLNVGVASLYALYGAPLLVARRVALRAVGVVLLFVFAGWVVALNLTIAHFRDLFIVGEGRVQMAQLAARVLTTPLLLSEAKSALLAALGGAVALLTVIEVTRSRDLYPGFSSVGVARERAIQRYATAKSKCLSALMRMRDSAMSDMTAVIDAIHDAEYDSRLAVEGRSRLHGRYIAYLDDLNAVYERLIRAYREANQRSRQTPPPAYFRRPMVRPPFLVAPALEPLPDVGQDVRSAVVELMEHYVKAINEKFEAALPEYRSVGQLTTARASGVADARL